MKSYKFHSIFTRTLAVATLAFGLHAAPAAAATYDMGALSARPYAVNFVALPAGSSFLDVYKFTLSSERLVAASAVSNVALLGGKSFATHISDFAVSFFNDSNPGVSLGSWSGSPMDFVSNLGVGDYSFKVSGVVDGRYGGNYIFSIANTTSEAISVTAVPEPEQWALFAIGLAFLGLMGRRRATRS